MADNHTKEVRSYNMSQIKSKDTKPEETVRKYLFSHGLRYRKNDKRYAGHPDIVLPKYRTIVFINGCFWHMHENCKYFVLPKSNLDYWIPKLERNSCKDAQNLHALTVLGWHVIVVWECQLKKENRELTLNKLYHEIIEQLLTSAKM